MYLQKVERNDVGESLYSTSGSTRGLEEEAIGRKSSVHKYIRKRGIRERLPPERIKSVISPLDEIGP